MMAKNLRLAAAVTAVSLACGFLSAPAAAKTKQGDKLLKQGQAAEQRGDWDRALDFYEQAVEESPNDPAYVIAMRRARFQSGQKHVDLGEKLRSEGKLMAALGEFQKALIIDPSSAIAIQEIRRTEQMIKQPAPKAEDRALTPADQARKADQERVDSMAGPPELKPVVKVIPPVKMNNQPVRVLYETIGKLAGINVVFDSQYTPQGRNFNVDLGNSTVEQAFDYLSVLTRTYWKPLTTNTIFVTEDNVTKRRDYEDNVVKVFYVTNATSVQEFQEIATAVRTVAEIRRVYTYNAQKAMVVRGTQDQVALAEKLVHDLDKPKSEVVVDVIVMEANSARTRDLAATIASGGVAGINIPIVFAPRVPVTIPGGDTSGGTTTGTTAPGSTTAITLERLGHLSTADWVTTLPGALLQAMLSDNRTKVLNSPQLRASDGQKVSLAIGDRIPYATGSFQPGVGTVGVSPLVSTQFNFAEVGVNVDMVPQVHSANELTLHLEINVSNVKQYVNLGGLSQPVIGQRKNIADLRLREGEITILSGLSTSQDSSAVGGIPGLVDVPVLKRFFSSEHTERDRGDLMIALIPHIIRTPDYTPENLRGIYAGTDQTVKITYEPPQEATPAVAPAKPEAPVTPPQQPAAVKPAAPGAGARVAFSPATVQTQVSNPFTLNVQLENVANAFSITPIHVKWDPMLLRLNDITPGDLLTRDGGRVTSVKDIRNDTGEATLSVVRLPDSAGVSGSGSAAVLNFVAVGQGQASVSVTELGLKNPQGEPVPVTLGLTTVNIQ
jgi:general secretion pathway protein D